MGTLTPTSVSPLRATSHTTTAQTILDHCYDELDAARFCGKSLRTLQRWRALRCGPPYVRLGNSVYYPKSELLAWALAQRTRR